MALKFHWLRKVADCSELIEEVLPGQSVVEVIGEGRVLVEGHRGVSEYNECSIDVKVCFGVVKILGCNLKLSVLDDNKLVISGAVQCVQLVRRSEK